MFERHRAGAQRTALALAAVLMIGTAHPAAAREAVLYRVFLRDGSTLISYGEFARVADRVVLSIPIGDSSGAPRLEVVSLPESTVDWDRTDRYTEAARAKQYADTRGESDFTLLGSEVARVLNEVALTEDPAKRLAMATEARRYLGEWPAKNYGYRAADVAQLTSMLDEVVSELRVAAGQSRFDLSFVANTIPAPPMELLPAPAPRESAEQAFTAARITSDPGERISLLRAIAESLREPSRREPWAAALYARAANDLGLELRIEKTYADLASRALSSADEHARDADVRGVEAVVAKVLKADDGLGRVRPQATAALLASLDARLDAARRLRLARDAWQLRVDVLRAYRKSIRGVVDQLRRSKPALEDIRQLAGPSAKALDELQRRASASAREIQLVTPPPELDAAHSLLAASLQMALRAATTRRTAVVSGNLNTAWDASSAASGALMMLERALADMNRLTTLPRLR